LRERGRETYTDREGERDTHREGVRETDREGPMLNECGREP